MLTNAQIQTALTALDACIDQMSHDIQACAGDVMDPSFIERFKQLRETRLRVITTRDALFDELTY